MKRTCSVGSSLNTPVKPVVSVETPCFWMPRMAMHMCSASIITATPRGFRCSSMALDDLGRQVLLRLQAARETSTTRASLERPTTPFARVIGDVRLAEERHDVVLAMGEEGDVAHEHDVAIAADLLEHRCRARRRRSGRSRRNISRKPWPRAAACRAGPRGRVVAGPADQGAHGRFGFLPGRALRSDAARSPRPARGGGLQPRRPSVSLPLHL